MPITPLFAAIFALIYIVLSLGVITIRLSKDVSLGSGQDNGLEKAIRIHGNFAEYVPLALLLLWFLETVVYNGDLALILACVLLASRLMHVVGMRDPDNYLIFRKLGVLGTFGVLAISAVAIIWHYLPI